MNSNPTNLSKLIDSLVVRGRELVVDLLKERVAVGRARVLKLDLRLERGSRSRRCNFGKERLETGCWLVCERKMNLVYLDLYGSSSS